MNRHSNRRSPAGVTLIETIMVITLLAAAAVAGSIMLDGQWVARRSVTSATNDIANSLITARNTAIMNQAQVRVRRIRSRGNQRLLITEDAGPYRDQKQWIVELGTDVRLLGRPRTIRFSPSGAANRSLSWTVRNSRSQGRIDVTPVTGQVNRRLP